MHNCFSTDTLIAGEHVDTTSLEKFTGTVTVSTGFCSVGRHKATFVGAFEMPQRDGFNHQATKLVFKSENNEQPVVIVSKTVTLKNSAGRILAGMLGRNLVPGENICWSDFKGQRFEVLVELHPNKHSTRVTEAHRIK